VIGSKLKIVISNSYFSSFRTTPLCHFERMWEIYEKGTRRMAQGARWSEKL